MPVYIDTLEKQTIAAIIFVVIIYGVKYIYDLLNTFVIDPSVSYVDFKSKGKWALITGSTEGIGKQYAKELAARGCCIILISRSSNQLRITSEEIERKYKVTTKTIHMDFCDGDGVYDKLAKDLDGLEIGTFVNNIDMTDISPKYNIDMNDQIKSGAPILQANIVSVTRVTEMLLPGMLARGKGVVINIGPVFSAIPPPLLTVYAATVAYVEKFCKNMDRKYRAKGIMFRCLL